MTAKRFNEGKPKLGYFARSFHWALEAVARVKEFGANKYADGNWRLGGKPDDEYLDSAARHLDLFLGGEIYDQDSGCHHLGHAIWNYCALMELNYKDTPVIDAELFAERMAHWAEQKRITETGTPLDDRSDMSNYNGGLVPPGPAPTNFQPVNWEEGLNLDLESKQIKGNGCAPSRSYKDPGAIHREDS